MLLCRCLLRWHGEPFPSSVGSPVVIGLLEFSDPQLVQVLVRHPQLVPVRDKTFCPFLWAPSGRSRDCPWYHCFIFMVLESAFLGASVAFSGFMVSSSNSRLVVCRENARTSQWKYSQRLSSSNDNLSDFTIQCGIDTAMVTKLEEGDAALSQKFTRAEHRHNILVSK